MSAPARPRPRPRPRVKPSGSSDAIPVGESSTTSAPAASKTIITINRENLTASSKTVAVPSAGEGTSAESVVIEVEDDDFDIFAKRRNAFKAVRPSTEEQTEPKSDQPIDISSSESESDFSDGDGHRHRRKRKKTVLNLPAWTQVGYKEKSDRKRQDTVASQNDGAGMSKAQRAQMARSPSAEKRDRQATPSASRARSRSISLTPPPQIASIPSMPMYRPHQHMPLILDDDDDLAVKSAFEWQPTSTGVQLGAQQIDDSGMNDDLAALIAKTRAKLAAEGATAPHANPTSGRTGLASEVPGFGTDKSGGDTFVDRGIMLQLTVTMKLDPIRAKNISARALKAYEKPKVFTIGSKCPLDPIYEKLAEVLDKEKEDIILSYNGERIWSSNFTPERLKIYTDDKIEGYEKEAWERTQMFNHMEQERKLREAEMEMAERHAAVVPVPARLGFPTGQSGAHEIDDDEIAVTGVKVVNPATMARAGSTSVAPGAESTPALDSDNDGDQETAAILTLTLRGAQGDIKAKAKTTTKMSALMAYYVKVKKVTSPMGIELDGEILEGDSTVADADLDDGDMLGVMLLR